MIEVRRATSRDMNALVDMDLKSHEYPWPAENWGTVIPHPETVIFIAQLGVKNVGFCVAQALSGELKILRMGTVQKARGSGVAKAIMRELNALANSLRSDTLTVLVPEIHCLPGHPDDVSALLNKAGFQATEIIKDNFLMYGEQVDGFKFVKELT